MNKRYDFAKAKSYWRYAPSGRGKHDTAVLASESDRPLLAVWDEAFRSRFRNYPEEDRFLRWFAPSTAGERLLSIGSGLGFHEVACQSLGARVTCADIVPSNLKVISRIAALKGLPAIGILDLDGPARPFPESYDTIFIYGSLMHMPRPDQRSLLARAADALGPNGRIVLMVYTWEFARRTCGWQSPDEFDEQVFGQAADPSIGGEHSPWSDWYDDERLLELMTPEWQIAKRQLWNDGLYAWYELRRGAPGVPAGFFDPRQGFSERVVHRIRGDEFMLAAAAREGASVITNVGHFEYAASSPTYAPSPESMPNAVEVSTRLKEGAISVGLLDQRQDAFVACSVVTAIGPHRLRLHVSRFPDACQVIISNHHTGDAGRSVFDIETIEFLAADLIEPPQSIGS